MNNTLQIDYKTNATIDPGELIELYKSAALQRPTDHIQVRKMIIHAKLTISAWDGNKLIGIARCLTDFSFCCMLADLAVQKEYQNKGIGTRLLELAIQEAEEGAIMLVLASGSSKDFLLKKGFKDTPQALMLKV